MKNIAEARPSTIGILCPRKKGRGYREINEREKKSEEGGSRCCCWYLITLSCGESELVEGLILQRSSSAPLLYFLHSQRSPFCDCRTRLYRVPECSLSRAELCTNPISSNDGHRLIVYPSASRVPMRSIAITYPRPIMRVQLPHCRWGSRQIQEWTIFRILIEAALQLLNRLAPFFHAESIMYDAGTFHSRTRS